MAAVSVTHTATSARFEARSMTDTLASKTDILASRSVPFAMATGVLAVDAAVFAVDAAAFAMDGLSILSVQRCLARPMRVAHDPAKIQPIVVRNFAPAFPGLMHCYDVVEALAGFISQHVCSLQFAVAESGRSSLGLQRIDGNAGFLGNSRQHSSARNSDSEHQEECRYDQA